MDTLQSIENLPSESESAQNEELPFLDFRFQARNISVDWRKLSLIDVDHIAETMDIDLLQEYIELVTYANLDELTNIDPLFVKLFRLSQFTIEYLLHSQDFLKLVLKKEKEKVQKREKKMKVHEIETKKFKTEILQIKKENKKRRRIVEEQQRMLEVGANSFYKCPICPSKTFINATYLQSHLHRRHQEHTTYIGDAILHTKAITQNLEDKLVSVQDRIELEKRRNEELVKKSQEDAKRAEEKIFEQQEHIQRLERTRYENKLKELEESFTNEVDTLKTKEKRYVQRINELEGVAEKSLKTESMVKSIKKDIPKIEEDVYQKISEMEQSIRHQQHLTEEAVKQTVQQKRIQTKVSKSPHSSFKSSPKKKVALREDPVDLVAEEEARRRQFMELKEQFRPSMVNLLHTELEKLGIKIEENRLSDNMFKIKLEQLRNNRANKIVSRPNFHDFRNEIESALESRSNEKLNQALDDSHHKRPERPMGPPKGSPKRSAKPSRPTNPPSPPKIEKPKPKWSDGIPDGSPGKPNHASTMKGSSGELKVSTVGMKTYSGDVRTSTGEMKTSTDVQSSSDWASEPIKPATKFKNTVIEQTETETVTEKSEEDQTSAWDTDEESMGQDVKSKAKKIEEQLSNRHGTKPAGGIDLSGVHDQTNMAVDELFDGDSEPSH